MNNQAQKHLDKAVKYIAKGDDFYAKAADEIIAAQKADFSLSNREIGERFGKGSDWVRRIVAWRTSGSPASQPINWERGSHATTAEVEAGAVSLPPEKAAAVAEKILARDDVVEHLAEDDEVHDRVVNEAQRKVAERWAEKQGTAGKKPIVRRSTPTVPVGTELLILAKLSEAADLAIQYGREAFFIEHANDQIERVEQSIEEGGSATKMVTDIEEFLADEAGGATV